MKNKNIRMLLGMIVCMQLQASDSPKGITNNFSDDNFTALKDKNKIGFDEDEFFDAETGLDDIPVLESRDIEALDQYSGVDIYFDDLYKFAKRDLYLAQQNEKMFPDKVHSYENLKKYYGELKNQRQEMVTIKQAMNKLVNNNYRMLHGRNFEPSVQSQLDQLQIKADKIYYYNVRKPLQNQKMLVNYKVPYEPQLQINKIKLAQARIMLKALQQGIGK